MLERHDMVLRPETWSCNQPVQETSGVGGGQGGGTEKEEKPHTQGFVRRLGYDPNKTRPATQAPLGFPMHRTFVEEGSGRDY